MTQELEEAPADPRWETQSECRNGNKGKELKHV